MLKTFTKLSRISTDYFLRCDEKYHYIESISGFNIFNVPDSEQILLKDILEEHYNKFIYEEDKEYKGIPTGQAYIDNDGDIIGYQLVTLDDHPNRLQYSITNSHILISSLRLAKSPALSINDGHEHDYVISNGFYCFIVKNGWEKRFILHLLRTSVIKSIIDNNIYRGIGISSYKSRDLLKIPIRNISIKEQTAVLEKISLFENKISELKSKRSSINKIIDDIFSRKFNLDYQKLSELDSHRYYVTKFLSVSQNQDLRFSARFHRPAGNYVMKQLNRISDKKIKDFIDEPIVLGAGVSPTDFDSNGTAYYVSMATIKTLSIELDDTQLLSDDYYSSHLNKNVKINDIIMARSGVAIGKVAIVKEEFDGVFADFTMRIRFNKEKYNPQFAYYYFRTTYFQYLIEVYKKGLQNRNIYPSIIQEFPIPDISLSEQQKLVDEIDNNIHEQDKINEEILKLRKKIENIIIATIRNDKGCKISLDNNSF